MAEPSDLVQSALGVLSLNAIALAADAQLDDCPSTSSGRSGNAGRILIGPPQTQLGRPYRLPLAAGIIRNRELQSVGIKPPRMFIGGYGE
jgi:hypothetical protein